MEIFSMTEISIPITQMVLLLLLSTGALFFGKLKLALLINYLFTLYWGYGINKDFLADSGFQHLSGHDSLCGVRTCHCCCSPCEPCLRAHAKVTYSFHP
jgi:hypothetical protein